MFALYRKELAGFLSSLSGYIVITIFTTLNGLFIWVFPGEMNILESGYASMASLFLISPWMFLFLIPSITMRTISEEVKSGTMEILYSQPKSEFEIVFAKYLASFSLAVIALVPTLIYLIILGVIGSPSFNFDLGGISGSYIGLVLLAAVYSSIGVFASSLSENTIVSFLIAVLLCFLVYAGFDYASRLFQSGMIGTIILNLGIDAHYQSISRGVIDSRDIIYYLSAVAVFLVATTIKLRSRLWN